MSVQVKICGITSVEAADATVRAGADFAGLMFYESSPRHVPLAMAQQLAGHMRGRLQIVAVFADAGDDAISAAVTAVRPQYLQLHGSETAARVAEIRERFQTPVIKAVSVAQSADIAAATAYDGVADMFLFDAKAPRGADRPGGHGAAFDWQLLRGWSFSRPWLLSGGLHPENVARAVAATGATAVDVSSGVESAPGIKSAEKIAAFAAAAKSAQQAKAPV